MRDTTGLAEVMLGLAGFRVLDVQEVNDGAELVVKVETTATAAGCPTCGTRAVVHERRAVDETSFQAANPAQSTQYVTGLIDANRRAMIEGPKRCVSNLLEPIV
jgi:hypothetical protein